MRPSFVGSVSVRKSGWPGQARCAPDFTVRAGFVVRISFRSSKPGRDGEQIVTSITGRHGAGPNVSGAGEFQGPVHKQRRPAKIFGW